MASGRAWGAVGSALIAAIALSQAGDADSTATQSGFITSMSLDQASASANAPVTLRLRWTVPQRPAAVETLRLPPQLVAPRTSIRFQIDGSTIATAVPATGGRFNLRVSPAARSNAGRQGQTTVTLRLAPGVPGGTVLPLTFTSGRTTARDVVYVVDSRSTRPGSARSVAAWTTLGTEIRYTLVTSVITPADLGAGVTVVAATGPGLTNVCRGLPPASRSVTLDGRGDISSEQPFRDGQVTCRSDQAALSVALSRVPTTRRQPLVGRRIALVVRQVVTDPNRLSYDANGRIRIVPTSGLERNSTLSASLPRLPGTIPDVSAIGVRGTVRTTAGRPAAGVQVKLTSPNGRPSKDRFGRTLAPVRADGEGAYEFTNLPGGRYRVQVVGQPARPQQSAGAVAGTGTGPAFVVAAAPPASVLLPRAPTRPTQTRPTQTPRPTTTAPAVTPTTRPRPATPRPTTAVPSAASTVTSVTSRTTPTAATTRPTDAPPSARERAASDPFVSVRGVESERGSGDPAPALIASGVALVAVVGFLGWKLRRRDNEIG